MNNKIIYLLRNSPKDLLLFEKSIDLLKQNFLPSNPYPVIVFHEGIKKEYFTKFNIDIISQEISFKIPNFLNKNEIPENIYIEGIPFPFSIGYRHMCRFYSGMMYLEEVLKDTDYYLRLDNDSFILKPVNYDIFKYMDNNDKIYGFNSILTDNPKVVEGLWEKTEQYSKNKSVLKQPFIDIKHPLMYYTNFEVAKFNWFLEKDYKEYFNFLDLDGGIYKKRWGDAPIKYLGIEMFLEDDKKHCFKDIDYKHGNIFNY